MPSTPEEVFEQLVGNFEALMRPTEPALWRTMFGNARSREAAEHAAALGGQYEAGRLAGEAAAARYVAEHRQEIATEVIRENLNKVWGQ